MITLNIDGMLFEVEEKYLRPVQPMEVLDVEYTEHREEVEEDGE